MLTTDTTKRRVTGGFYLVEMFFTQGVQRLTTWPVDKVWGGDTYRSIGELGAVGGFGEADSGAQQKVTLTLSPVSLSTLALALGNVEGYRGKPVNVYYWPVDDAFQTRGEPILRYFGSMDKVSITRDENSGSIKMECLPGGFDSPRRKAALRMNHVQQQKAHPGDMGFEFQQGLIEQPPVWLTKAFQSI